MNDLPLEVEGYNEIMNGIRIDGFSKSVMGASLKYFKEEKNTVSMLKCV